MRKREIAALVLAGVFLLLAALCRFVLPGVRFSALLSVGAAALLLLGVLLDRLARRSGKWRRVRTGFHVCLLLFAVFFAGTETVILARSAGDLSVRPDAVIVLGAGVNGTVPSLALSTRLETAAAYLEAHPNVPVVLSGGQGPGEEITEAQAMYRDLIRRGIPAGRLLLEERSRNTEENFAFSKALLRENGIEPETAVVAVVTNDFHLCRARLLARRQGMPETAGVPAKLPWLWLSANYYAREAFALAETLFLRH